jgi:hypothetical protein
LNQTGIKRAFTKPEKTLRLIRMGILKLILSLGPSPVIEGQDSEEREIGHQSIHACVLHPSFGGFNKCCVINQRQFADLPESQGMKIL